MSRKYFGTDGIRGRVGEGAISAEFVLHLGWAVGKVFAREGRSSVLIGKDTRISGYMFESALQAGLSAAGVDVRLLGPMPTPAIAYLTRIFRAQAGIVISASHNPFHDNGIKFFSSQGTKLPDSVEQAIEAKMDSPISTVDSAELGKASRIPDASGRYIEYCKSTVPMRLDLSGMRIGLDCANGATYHIAPAVLEELGATVYSIGIDPDGLNINHQCGSTYPQALKELVLEQKLDLGIALDGDGDRLIMVDHQGEEVDGDELLFIIARDKKEQARLKGGVVGTLMSNLGLELALADLDIPFARAKVGDRYVMELLQQQKWMLGGESSGHILCLDAGSTGDGIVSALQVLAAMQRTELSLADLKQGLTKLPQRMINVPLAQNFQAAPKALTEEVHRVEQALAQRGRVLLRPSGTEPVLRVMVEGEDQACVSQYAEDIANVARKALA